MKIYLEKNLANVYLASLVLALGCGKKSPLSQREAEDVKVENHQTGPIADEFLLSCPGVVRDLNEFNSVGLALTKSDVKIEPLMVSHGKANNLTGGKSHSIFLLKTKEVTPEIQHKFKEKECKVAQNYALAITAIPNDTLFPVEWAKRNIGQAGGLPGADMRAHLGWDLAVGTGQTVIGVIDTGVDYNHVDLRANMWTNPNEIPGNGVDDDGNGIIDDIYGASFVGGPHGNPMDTNNHGTAVTGVAGAVGNNGTGIAGTAWKTRIMAIQIAGGDGTTSVAKVISGLNYAVQNGAKVVNLSIGGTTEISSASVLQAAMQNAALANVIVVAAAGNVSSNNDVTPFYPASLTADNVVSVAATDRYDNRAPFSNYGAISVDLAAPGYTIHTTLRNSTYGSYSGTSMAAPFVTGAIAVCWDKNPSLSYRDVIQKLFASVRPLASLSGITATGGILNMQGFIAACAGPAPTPTPTPPPPVAPTAPTVLILNQSGATFAPALTTTLSRLTGLKLTFNTAISSVQPLAFSLTNGSTTITSADGDAIVASIDGNVVTLAFTGSSGVNFGSLADGIWTLTTDLTKVQSTTSTSGTGTATQGIIRRLFGDVNSDGTVNLDDYQQFGSTWGLSQGDAGFKPAFDYNADSTVNGADFTQFGNRFGVTL